MIVSLKKLIYKFKTELIFQIITVVTISLIGILMPYIEGILVNNIVYGKNCSIFIALILTIAILAFLKLALSYFTAKLEFFKLYKINTFIVNKIIEKLFKSKSADIEKFESTYLHSRISEDTQTIVSYIFLTYPTLISSLIITSIVLIFLLLFKIEIFIMFLFFLFAYSIIYIFTSKKIYDSDFKVKENSARFFSNRNSIINRYNIIKSKGILNFEIDRNKKLANNMFGAMKYNFRWNYIMSTSQISLTLIFQVLFFLIGGYFVLTNQWEIGVFTFITQYFSILIGILDTLFDIMVKRQNFAVSSDRINTILNIPDEKQGLHEIDEIDAVSLVDFNPYNTKDKLLYSENLNYTFEKSNVYFITGKNGVGKTTLILNMIGIKSNHSGEILINSHHIYDYNMDLVRKNCMSVMLQNEAYEDIQVRNYISKFKINVNNEDVFFNGSFNLNDCLDKNMNDLSGGEKQIIDLYVTLFKRDASLILLDEPFSNLSQKMTNLFLNHIYDYSKDKIIIIISHDNNIVDDKHEIEL